MKLKRWMNFKWIMKIIVLVEIILLMEMNTVFADIEETENETVDIETIKNEVIETVETASNVTKEPSLDARIGLIFDRSSKRILYEKNGLKQVPMASTTKIMTSIVVLENANLSDVVTVDKKAAGTGGSRLGLSTNDKITVHDLLYGLMLRSGNDAAVALAIHVGGSVEGFAEMMNQKAKQMGWNNSHFVTPHGLDEKEHYTTAYELACMADYALEIPKFKEIVGSKSYYITINGQSRLIYNTHELLGNLSGVYGVKTGFTNGAGRCLVTACKRGDLDIITVVLGADTKTIRTKDSMKLIEYAYQNYEIIDLEKIVKEQFEKWQQLNEKRIYINKGKTNEMTTKIEELSYQKIAIKNTQKDNITININCLYYFEAPVEQDRVIGKVEVKVGDEIIDTLDIKNDEEIQKKEVWDYFMEFLALMP